MRKIASVAFVFFVAGAWAAPGEVDATFGTGGRVTTPITGAGDIARAIVYQPDGKLIVAGPVANGSGGFGFGMARYLPDGTLDPAFGVDGKVALVSESIADAKIGFALQSDGRIVAAMASTVENAMVVRRFDARGAADSTFGTAGRLSITAGRGAAANSIVVQPDGKIVAGGIVLTTDRYEDFALARLTSDGSLDPSFGVGGIALADWAGSADLLDDFALMPDGGFVLIGTSLPPGFEWTTTLAGLKANGAIDSAFGTGSCCFSDAGPYFARPFPGGGWALPGVAYAPNHTRSTRLAATDDGRIVIAMCCGPVGMGGAPALKVDRLLRSGFPDRDFSPGITPVFSTTAGVEALRIQTDGRFLVAQGNVVRRFTVTGYADPGFSEGGVRTLTHAVHALAMQPNNLVLAAGDTYSPKQFVVSRVDSNRLFAVRGDLTGDGWPDIYFYRTDSFDGWLWAMRGPQFLRDSPYTGAPQYIRVGTADFSGKGTNNMVFWDPFNNGRVLTDENYSAFSSHQVDPVWRLVAVVDMNGDGYPDLIYRNQESGTAFVWYLEKGYVFGGDQFLFSIDPAWELVAAIDFNADGMPDFLFRNRDTGIAFVWDFDGTNLAGDHFLFGIDPVWEIVHVADWNHDGKPDLVFRNRDTGLAFAWYMDGYTLTTSDFLFSIDPVWKIAPS